MIQNRNDLKLFMAMDKHRNGNLSGLKYYIKLMMNSEDAITLRYLKILRLHEYYNNTGSLLRYYYLFLHRRLDFWCGISIPINVVGPGLYIAHLGGVIINCKSMGSNCTISSGVVIGNKTLASNVATIGDNVELTVGCKVIGKLTIGNNVIVAPNSVVINDIPNNCVVSGVPAKIIKKDGIVIKE